LAGGRRATGSKRADSWLAVDERLEANKIARQRANHADNRVQNLSFGTGQDEQHAKSMCPNDY